MGDPNLGVGSYDANVRRLLGMAAILVSLLLAACDDGWPAKAAETQAGSTSVASAEPAEPQVRFTAAGDFGSTEETDAVLKMIKSLDSDATFALGDLSYGRTGAEN